MPYWRSDSHLPLFAQVYAPVYTHIRISLSLSRALFPSRSLSVYFCVRVCVRPDISISMVSRYADAMEWSGMPSVASFGMTQEGLEVHIGHGRVYVGYEGDLLAYFSEIPQVCVHV